MWLFINYKPLLRVGVLMITCTGGIHGSELPSLPRIPKETMMELRRLSEAYMQDFSRERYAKATKELALALGVEEGVEKEAAHVERKILSQDRVGLGGEPIEGSFIFVGSRAIGHREVRFVYLDQRSLGSCVVVIRFIKPADSWIAGYNIGIAGTRDDLEPFWVVNEPGQLAALITEFPSLLDATQKCMHGIVAGEGREAFAVLLKRYGSKYPAALNERHLRSTGAQLENPPYEFGESLDHEFLGATRIADQELRVVYLWQFKNGDFHRQIPVSFGFSRSGNDWHFKYLSVGDTADPDMHAFTVNRNATISETEQDGAGQPATRSESDSKGGDKPQPEPEERSR